MGEPVSTLFAPQVRVGEHSVRLLPNYPEDGLMCGLDVGSVKRSRTQIDRLGRAYIFDPTNANLVVAWVMLAWLWVLVTGCSSHTWTVYECSREVYMVADDDSLGRHDQTVADLVQGFAGTYTSEGQDSAGVDRTLQAVFSRVDAVSTYEEGTQTSHEEPQPDETRDHIGRRGCKDALYVPFRAVIRSDDGEIGVDADGEVSSSARVFEGEDFAVDGPSFNLDDADLLPPAGSVLEWGFANLDVGNGSENEIRILGAVTTTEGLTERYEYRSTLH